jgi:ubiquitin
MSAVGSPADAAAAAVARGFSKIRIFIETLTGTTVTVDAHTSDTVNVLKARFRQIQGIPHHHRSRHCLSLRGQALEDNWATPTQAQKTLAEYNIENENTLQQVPPSDCKMTLHVRFLQPEKTTTAEMQPWETFGELKAIIAGQEGVPISSVRLIFGGHQQQDENTLLDCRIPNGSTLHCVLGLFNDTSSSEGFQVTVDCSSPDRSSGSLAPPSPPEAFDLEVSDTVDSLKAKIQDRVGVPPDQQSLFFQGSLLQNGKTLAECGVCRGQERPLRLEMKPNWSPEPQMVHCYDVTGKTQTASFDLDVSDTVDSLKAKIQDRVGVPPDQQRLFFRGSLLQDGRTLAECGVNSDVKRQKDGVFSQPMPRNVIMKPKHEVPLDSSTSLSGEITCKDGTGISCSIFVELTDTVYVVKAKLEDKIHCFPRAIIFFGQELEDCRTLAECGIEFNDTLFFFGPRLKGDIGVFVSTSDSEQLPSGKTLPAPCVPGAQWLMQPALPSPLPPPSAVAELVRSFRQQTLAPTAARPPLSELLPAFSCVAEAACMALRARVDQAHSRAFLQHTQDLADLQVQYSGNDVAQGVAAGSCEDDFRLPLALQELRSVVGDDACARILSALETDAPDAIVLRRTVASGRWINFHTDTAARTVQVTPSSSSSSSSSACRAFRVASKA